MQDILAQMQQEFSNNPWAFIGFIICTIGVLIAAFGRKFFLFRWILGDRSMFSQIIIGIILFGIGIILIYFLK